MWYPRTPDTISGRLNSSHMCTSLRKRGFEYWFPRPLRGSDAPDGREDAQPLVILGGGREASGSGLEDYETDDSTLDPDVGRALKVFLQSTFPDKFDNGKRLEMKWTGIMDYTQNKDPFISTSPMVVLTLARGRASGGYEDGK
ncbi:hypothetical protein BD779DRAFT_1478378 [Infundibulicybe gibba]|nr:hypothetical protein BD779DRAFT_1478378 [Infundibulicybe gibba]